MPTTKRRIIAVAATGAIVLSGGWFAQMARPTPALAQQVTTADSVPDRITQSGEMPNINLPVRSNISNGPSMRVAVNGIRNDNGKVYIAVFDNADAFASFDYKRAAGFKELSPSNGRLSASFPDLTGNAYAVSVFHDENGNERFDMSGRYPTEGYGTSRAKNAYDDLKYHQAAVRTGPITIKMHYLK